MKKISKPEIKVIRFPFTDIISTSSRNPYNGHDHGLHKGEDKGNNPHHAPIWGAEDYEGDN